MKKRFSVLLKKKMIIITVTTLLVITLLLLLCYYGYLWPNSIFAMKYQVRGIDVSHYQEDIDWKMLAQNNNIKFVYMKATEGSDYQDDRFLSNWEGASQVGLIKGAYHYFTMKSSGSDQADNFIKVVPVESGCLPPVIDIEEDGVSKVSFKQNLNEFISRIEAEYHQKPILYTVYELYDEYIRGDYEDYSIWIRDIIKPPALSDRRQWLMWQYSNRGRLKGQNGFYDLNVFDGNKDDLDDLLSK